MKRKLPENKFLVLFDGYCNLCNESVQFILRRDRKDKFYFASLSWSIAQSIIAENGIPPEVDSILLWDGKVVYVKSSAALKIANHLGWFWPLLNIFWIVPRPIRDSIYDFVARNRYKWFGKKDTCMIPTPELKDKFLE